MTIKKILLNFTGNTLYGNSITTVLRIIMGSLFIYSGFFKAIDLESFGRAILMYDISPEILVPYAAVVFPFVELIIGLFLLFGYRIKGSSFLSVLLMVFWIIIISISIYRGKTFDCGCFELERFGIKEEIGFPLVFRDIVFLCFLLLVFYARKHNLSIDKLIEEKRLRNI
ncbi:MAG: DoxX family membrane protein [Spirochaetes bacterium]|nr:DoxX family membrane protein [Spirochaetota bacterium]